MGALPFLYLARFPLFQNFGPNVLPSASRTPVNSRTTLARVGISLTEAFRDVAIWRVARARFALLRLRFGLICTSLVAGAKGR